MFRGSVRRRWITIVRRRRRFPTETGNVTGTAVTIGGGSVGGSGLSVRTRRRGGGGGGRRRVGGAGGRAARTKRNFDALVERVRPMVAAGSADDPDIHNRTAAAAAAAGTCADDVARRLGSNIDIIIST